MGTPISSADLLRRIEVMERLLNIPPAPPPSWTFPPIQEQTFGPLTPQPVKYTCRVCGQTSLGVNHYCPGSNIGHTL